MKIIFNSDVLHNFALARMPGDVPKWLCDFCKKAEKLDSEIIIPETTLFELNYIQEKDIRRVKEEITGAYDILNSWKLKYEEVDLDEEIKSRDLIEELKNCGIEVSIEKPTIEDFQSAHKKACLKLPPHPPSEEKEYDSDEMRDIVIWSMAIRIAKTENGAMLLSKDHIHTDSYGDEEANKFNLYRQKGSDQALKFLGAETPSEKLIKDLLSHVWDEIRNEGFPINIGEPTYRAEAEEFEQDEKGLSKIVGKLKIQLGAGQSLDSDLIISLSEGVLEEVKLENIQSTQQEDIENIRVETNIEVFGEEIDFAERYHALKSLIN